MGNKNRKNIVNKVIMKLEEPKVDMIVTLIIVIITGVIMGYDLYRRYGFILKKI